MSFIVYVILIAVGGLFVGALARLALPGKDPMTLGQTMLIGIAGSLIGGLITYAVWDAGPGIAIVGAVRDRDRVLRAPLARRRPGRPRPPAARSLTAH